MNSGVITEIKDSFCALKSTRNPASRASKRLRLVAIRASSYVHRICNFKDCKEGIYFMFFQSCIFYSSFVKVGFSDKVTGL